MSGAPGSAPRKGRGWVILGLGLAVFALGFAIVDMSTREPAEELIEIEGISDSQRIFGGVRQLGDRLGMEDAPVSIQLFTDVQCAPCADEFLETVPTLVDGPIRDGDVQLLLRNRSVTRNPLELGFFGVQAASMQDYGWQYAYLFFRNQEEAERVRIDQDFLEALAGSIPELEVPEWTEDFEEGVQKGSDMEEDLVAQDELGESLDLPAEPAAVVSGPRGTEVLEQTPSLADVEQAIESVR